MRTTNEPLSGLRRQINRDLFQYRAGEVRRIVKENCEQRAAAALEDLQAMGGVAELDRKAYLEARRTALRALRSARR